MRIRCNSPKAAPLHEWKTSPGIMIRGGNHHMKPDDIYICIPRKKLVELGFLKEGELPNDSTASAVRRALKFDIKAVPDTRFGGNDYYLTISIGDISKEYYLEEYWYTKQGSSFENWLRNTHLTIRPEEVYESAGRAEAHDLREYYLDIWLTLTKDMGKSSDEADSLIEANSRVVQDCFDKGEGPVVAAQRIAGAAKKV